MQVIDQFIDQVQNLPAAPRILPELLALLNQPDIDSDRVVKLLTFDPGLTANVLRLCNSALLGASRPADDLQEAITRLGFRQVYQLVAAISGSRALTPAQPGYGMAAGELWQHCVTSAVATQLIAQDTEDDVSVAFTAGLLHDIGKVVLSGALQDKYSRIISETEKNQKSMRETEKELLGVDHAEVGGRLLERWKLPAALVQAVRHHHVPGDAGDSVRLASLVYLGNMVAHSIGCTAGYQSFALHGRAEVFEILNINPEKWPLYLIGAWENFQMARSLLSVKG